MDDAASSTRQKAVALNLDPAKYGTFAEIGAGQEVARWFFLVGGAAGTVAKTISAYDMSVSDAVYGRSHLYVSRERLQAMLDHEWGLLIERLNAKRGATATFFVFADTMATRSYSRHEDGQGWMGVRFQYQPQAEPSDILIHVRMLDQENVREQEAIGIMGVNLIHAAFYAQKDPAKLIASLMDNLDRSRVEVDTIRFSGPAFVNVDNRLMSLQLVEQGFTEASMFLANGEVVQASEILYKKPILIERGNFRPITNLTLDIVERASAQFRQELKADSAQGDGNEPFVILEMSLRDLLAGRRIDHTDFLARVDILGALGKTVLISSHGRHFRLVPYLRQYTKNRIAFAMGIPNLRE